MNTANSKLDLETWPRHEHFKVFRAMAFPHFNLTANVEVTLFKGWLKEHGISLTIGTMYALARTANAIPEFRLRIQGEDVVEYQVVHPSMTILTENDTFTFCAVPYDPDLTKFAAQAAERIAEAKANPTLDDGDWRDALLFMTSLPWVSFTSMVHAMHLSPADSVPRMAWGKIFTEGSSQKMPLNVQVHHALVDGLHIGRFFEHLQASLDHPSEAFG
jgi:chloramphenicol O-acetyltransferase type A